MRLVLLFFHHSVFVDWLLPYRLHTNSTRLRVKKNSLASEKRTSFLRQLNPCNRIRARIIPLSSHCSNGFFFVAIKCWNDYWDPGAPDIAKLQERAAPAVKKVTGSQVPIPSQRWKKQGMIIGGLLLAYFIEKKLRVQSFSFVSNLSCRSQAAAPTRPPKLCLLLLDLVRPLRPPPPFRLRLPQGQEYPPFLNVSVVTHPPLPLHRLPLTLKHLRFLGLRPFLDLYDPRLQWQQLIRTFQPLRQCPHQLV